MSSTTNKPIIDIGVACNIMQSYHWWVEVMQLLLNETISGGIEIGAIRAIGSALPDHNKNAVVGNQVKRYSLTDYNRTSVTKGFLDGRADYLFWLDDDTAPPSNTISKLVNSGRDFIGGIYFLPAPPFNPIAYKRDDETGLYAPIYNFPEGALMQIDSIGFGCTLVHRSVYEKIRDNHQVFVRKNGSLAAIHNSQVKNPIVNVHKKSVEPFVKNGIYQEQYTPQPEGDLRQFPYYQLEYGRTEDHYFCELAAAVGVKPYIDTTITCGHFKIQGRGYEDYKKELMESEGLL